ncbi:L-2-hydroxyglutarate oxidase [Akkermansiaceae bacterium]|nr:L-2-hydroxyglutarate oxidase [Akkermansiaceae bacterium]
MNVNATRSGSYDVVVIGAGIVGLATAFQLLQERAGIKLALVEKEKEIAKHQTGNNSGVIHSGIYYKPGSLKAENCRRGYQKLVDFCQAEEIPFEICGKIVVATDDSELPALTRIHERGKANGLENLELVDEVRLKEFEPHVRGVRGLVVPQAGIVDYKMVSDRYRQKIEAGGGDFFFDERVSEIQQTSSESKVEVVTGNRTLTAKVVVNCGGLYSDKLAKLTAPETDLQILPFRGEYYELIPEAHHLVKNLIYPVPNPEFPFLGVHFTRMIGGGIEAGPNAVLAFQREGYRKRDINLSELMETLTYPGFLKVAAKYWKDGFAEMYRSFSKRAFVNSLQKLVPEVKAEHLVPGGAGVRAQACNRSGQLLDDFVIVNTPGVINVCNAPSPAATSSLAIGETISQQIITQITK